MSADEVLLVDLSGIAHMLWHVSQDDPNPNATSTKVIARVRALATNHPHTVVCLDVGRSFRKDVDATYKGNRQEHLATLQHQIDTAIEVLKTDGFPCLGAKGYEADDSIATITKYILSQSESNVLICSSDKDLACLTESPRVRVQSATNGTIYDAAAVQEKFGVTPHQLTEFLMLCGDAADNIKGAEKIGPKNAASLLNTFGNLDDLYTALDEEGAALKPAIFTSLQAFRPRLETVRALLTLRTDVPIPFEEIFKPRVPVDVAVFGEDEDMMTDILEALPTLEQLANGGDEPPHQDVKTYAIPAGQRAAVVTLPPPTNVAGIAAEIAAEWKGIDKKAEQMGMTTLPVKPEVINGHVEWERALEPRNMDEMVRYANLMFKSRLFSQWGHVEQCAAIVAAGRELGVPAQAALRSFHNIQGRPTLSASLMRGLVLRSGKAEYFQCIERTPTQSTWESKRKGNPAPTRLTYTIEQAKASWTKGDSAWQQSPWKKLPEDMCAARASSKLARLEYDDVLLGLYAKEEFDDQ